MPIKQWPEFIGEIKVANAILDRILKFAQRIELKGESLRLDLEKKKENK